MKEAAFGGGGGWGALTDGNCWAFRECFSHNTHLKHQRKSVKYLQAARPSSTQESTTVTLTATVSFVN